MPTRTAKGIDAETKAATDAADVFITENRNRKEAEKKYADAKSVLFEWLGARDSKALPDGRTVTRSYTPIAEESAPRQAFTRTTLTVSPPPAA